MNDNRPVICEKETVTINSTASERFLPLYLEELKPLAQAGLTFGGHAIQREEYRVERLNPRWHTLIFSVEGNGRMTTAGQTTELTTGDVWAAPAGLAHSYEMTGNTWTIAWLCFRTDNSLGVCPMKPRVIHSPSCGATAHTIRQLITETDVEQHDSPQMVAATGRVLRILCSRVARVCGGAAPDHRRLMLEKAFESVRAQPGIDWGVSELVKASGLSITGDRLRQLCRQYFGVSPMRRVAQIRMQLACEILAATDYAIYTIAPMLGYNNEAAFSTAFRRETGTSPRAYRQSGHPPSQ